MAVELASENSAQDVHLGRALANHCRNHGTQRLRHTTANISLQVFSLKHAYSQRNTQNAHSRTTTMFSISMEAVVKAYLLPLISLIYPAVKPPGTSPKPTRVQPKFWMPSFRSPHTLPTEIILQFAELLDEASLLALRHTNRDLFYIISLTPDQNSRLPEVYQLAALRRLLRRLANEYDKDRQGFCTTCQEHRPLTSFSLSEVMALDRCQQASCLQHNRFWLCPHVNCDYQSMLNLRYDGRNQWSTGLGFHGPAKKACPAHG